MSFGNIQVYEALLFSRTSQFIKSVKRSMFTSSWISPPLRNRKSNGGTRYCVVTPRQVNHLCMLSLSMFVVAVQECVSELEFSG